MPDNKMVVQADHLREQSKVVESYLKGEGAKTIAERTNIPYARVMKHIREWRELAANNPAVRARAKEALLGADEHYAMLIKEAWQTLGELNSDMDSSTPNVAKAKTSAIKAIADIEKARVDMLHRAGLLENDELAEQIAETERKQEILIGILREVTQHCEDCRLEVARRLSRVADDTEVVTVEFGPH